ncbi:MAG: transcriptional repressor [Bacilli bacterium]|jgi:Fur family ferric uptake transcriptional regulator|nr:transcriptional repressor [Bacilli bacterium]HHU23775.1 transcriptional repressor [Acholeplasmataceae bacterium]
MNRNYHTKQRSIILDLLKANQDRHLTAEEMLELFNQNQTPVSKATLYRYLDMLVSQNAVRKFIIDNQPSAGYQYIEEGDYCHEHFHLKCLECGVLLHVECDEFDQYIKEKYQFIIDQSKIIIYGTCHECSNKKGDL